MRFAVLTLIVVASVAGASDLTIGRFSAGDLSGWEEKAFKGKTEYRIVPDGGRTVLEAQSRGTASGLFRKAAVDPRKYPLLRWSWKVAGTIPQENARLKSGDDYAARVYVVFKKTFFWQTRGIAYVWSANLPKGSSVPNAYTGNVVMVAAESGDAKAGTWVAEERNVLDDYRRLFGEEPPKIAAVAVMTDTDDTGARASAWYGDISLAPSR
jgi:hypothetical protein